MASRLRNLPFRAFSQSRNVNSNCTPPFFLARQSPVAPFRRAFPTLPLTHRNTMATSDAPKKMEWLVVIPDFPGAHEKRLEVRP